LALSTIERKLLVELVLEYGIRACFDREVSSLNLSIPYIDLLGKYEGPLWHPSFKTKGQALSPEDIPMSVLEYKGHS